MSIAEIRELRFCLQWAFKHALLLHVPFCVSWAFLINNYNNPHPHSIPNPTFS